MSKNSFQLGDLVEIKSYKDVRSVYLVAKIKITYFGSRVIELENINGKETRIIGECDLYDLAIKL